MSLVQIRMAGPDMFLEACIENMTKGPMCLDYCRFDAMSPVSATAIDVRDAPPIALESAGPLETFINTMQVCCNVQQACSPHNVTSPDINKCMLTASPLCMQGFFSVVSACRALVNVVCAEH